MADSMRDELRQAVKDLSARGLTAAAKWAAEQLVGLPEQSHGDGASRATAVAARDSEGVSELESDSLMLAKQYFDLREYTRAASVLDVRGACSAQARFLRLYATYLAGERRKEERAVEEAGPLGESRAENEELPIIEDELRTHCAPLESSDPFLLYLLGLVLLRREKKASARAALLASVHAYPCNWSAWLALHDVGLDPEPPVVPSADVGMAGASSHSPQSDRRLPSHWMSDFFSASLLLEMQENEEGLSRYAALAVAFPRSEYVLAQTATARYNLRHFDEAESLFERLRRQSPHRIEGMDTFSNILYVKEAYAALSHLAHAAVSTDKFRPETCCIVGNYYSLRAQHNKAVTYFRRALKLNRRYLSAWTLMGHEFVEMKNPEAAIEAYRRAVNINPRDYRAWYGLGQTYEVLRMPYYALYYFRQATTLRPQDARFWCAMGQCYESEQLDMQVSGVRACKGRRQCTQASHQPGGDGKPLECHAPACADLDRADTPFLRSPSLRSSSLPSLLSSFFPHFRMRHCDATRTPRRAVTARASRWLRSPTCTASGVTWRRRTSATSGTWRAWTTPAGRAAPPRTGRTWWRRSCSSRSTARARIDWTRLRGTVRACWTTEATTGRMPSPF